MVKAFTRSFLLIWFCFMAALLHSCGPGGPQVVIQDHRQVMQVEQPTEQSPDTEGVRPYGIPRIHSMGTMENPSVVIFRARDDGWTREVIVNDSEPILVHSGEATANQYFPFGRHKVIVRKWRDIPPFGKTQVQDRVVEIHVRPERGRAQIIYL